MYYNLSCLKILSQIPYLRIAISDRGFGTLWGNQYYGFKIQT